MPETRQQQLPTRTGLAASQSYWTLDHPERKPSAVLEARLALTAPPACAAVQQWQVRPRDLDRRLWLAPRSLRQTTAPLLGRRPRSSTWGVPQEQRSWSRIATAAHETSGLHVQVVQRLLALQHWPRLQCRLRCWRPTERISPLCFRPAAPSQLSPRPRMRTGCGQIACGPCWMVAAAHPHLPPPLVRPWPLRPVVAWPGEPSRQQPAQSQEQLRQQSPR